MHRRHFIYALLMLAALAVSLSVPPPRPLRAVPPNDPTNLRAISNYGTNQIQLSWTDASNDETGFEIQRRADGGAWSTVTTTAANATSYNDAGANTTTALYEYRVRAVKTGDSPSGWSNLTKMNLMTVWPVTTSHEVLHNWNETIGSSGIGRNASTGTWGGTGFHMGVDIQNSDASNRSETDWVVAARSGIISRIGNNATNNVAVVQVLTGIVNHYYQTNHLANGTLYSVLDTVLAGDTLGVIDTLYFNTHWVDHTHYYIHQLNGQEVTTIGHPLSIYTNVNDRDPMNQPPALIEHTNPPAAGDSIFEFFSVDLGTYINYSLEDPLHGNIDIIVEVGDSLGTNPDQVPTQLGYWIDALDSDIPGCIDFHDVKSEATQYVLFSWATRYFGRFGNSMAMSANIVDTNFDVSGNFSENGNPYPGSWPNYKHFIVTNTDSTTGTFADVNAASSWNTDAMQVGAIAETAPRANMNGRPDTNIPTNARFPDGNYRIHVLASDLEHNNEDLMFDVRLENFAPVVCECKPKDFVFCGRTSAVGHIRFSERMDVSAAPNTVVSIDNGATFTNLAWAANQMQINYTIGNLVSGGTYTITVDANNAKDLPGTPGGNELDGNNDGTAGDDFTCTFEVIDACPSPSPSPGPSPSPTPFGSPSPGASPSPTPSVTPSPSPSLSPSPSPSVSPAPSPSASPGGSPRPGASPSPSPMSSPGMGPSPGASRSPEPTPTLPPVITPGDGWRRPEENPDPTWPDWPYPSELHTVIPFTSCFEFEDTVSSHSYTTDDTVAIADGWVGFREPFSPLPTGSPPYTNVFDGKLVFQGISGSGANLHVQATMTDSTQKFIFSMQFSYGFSTGSSSAIMQLFDPYSAFSFDVIDSAFVSLNGYVTHFSNQPETIYNVEVDASEPGKMALRMWKDGLPRPAAPLIETFSTGLLIRPKFIAPPQSPPITVFLFGYCHDLGITILDTPWFWHLEFFPPLPGFIYWYAIGVPRAWTDLGIYPFAVEIREYDPLGQGLVQAALTPDSLVTLDVSELDLPFPMENSVEWFGYSWTGYEPPTNQMVIYANFSYALPDQLPAPGYFFHLAGNSEHGWTGIYENVYVNVPVSTGAATPLVEAAFDISRNGVDLRWHLDDTGGISAFHIYRAPAGAKASERERLTRSKIGVSSVGVGGWFSYIDRSVRPGGKYDYWIETLAASGGARHFYGPTRVTVPVVENRLYQNVPNPFNPDTRIAFDLVGPEHVSLLIYDVAGRRIRTLIDEVLPAGAHSVVWDGRDEAGRQAATGVYFYRFQAGNQIETKKMVMLK